MTKLKVIIPIYNSAVFLTRCIDSILNQTEDRFEVILIDDGSTDGSSEICDQYAMRDSRFHVVHQDNKGLSAARNVGIDYPISSEYMTFIDSDDWIPPWAFETSIDSLVRTGCNLVIGKHKKTDHYCLDKQDSHHSVLIMSPEECYCSKKVSVSPAWGKVFSTDLFCSIRFPEGKTYEEFATTWKIVFAVNKIAVISDIVYYYYINRNGIINSRWNPSKMEFFRALYEKKDFFHNNGYYEAERRAWNKILKMSEKYIVQIQREGEYICYLSELLRIRNDATLWYQNDSQ